MGKNVITFSLYGNLSQYTIGSINNAKIALELYKGWECWFYVDITTVPSEIISELLKLSNVRIIYKDINYVNVPMYWKTWRFEAIDDNNVDVMISRDTDTLIYRREIVAVDEWLKSDMSLHIIKDSPCHRYNIIQGGMFGLKKDINKIKKLPNMTFNAYKYFTENYNPDLTDLSFLEDFLYPILKNDSFVHDEFTPMFDQIDNGKYYKPHNHIYNKFPIRYNPEFNFIGEYRYADGTRDIETCNILENVLKYNPHMIQKYKDIKYCLLFCFDTPNINKYLDYYNFYNEYGINTLLTLFLDYIPDELIEFKNNIILINHRNKDFYDLSIILLPLLLKINNNLINDGIIIHDIDLFDLENIKVEENNFIKYFKDNSNEEMILYSNNFNNIDRFNKLVYIGDVNYIRYKLDIYDDMSLLNLYEKYNNIYNLLTILNNTIYPIIKDLTKYIIYNKHKDVCGIVDMYIIHYTKLVDRKIFMTNQINELGLNKLFNIIWIEDYDRENISEELKNKYYHYDYKLRYLTDGEIANGIAHMSVINSVYLNNKTSLIVEDDIFFRKDFISRLNYLSTLKDKWDILTIGGCFDGKNSGIINEMTDTDNIKLIKSPINSTLVSCYILKPYAAKKIMDNKLYKPFHTPIDDHLGYILYENTDLNILWCKPWLGVEGSKIGNMFTTSFKDRGF